LLPPLAGAAVMLLDLQSVSRTVRPGRRIATRGKRCNAVLLITDGVAISYRLVRDGQRQIIKLLLPGDFAGVTNCRFESALYSIETVTRTTFSPIPVPQLLGLFDTHPQLAARLFWSFSCDTAILGERLIRATRRPATERIGHFLLELLTRLQRIGLAGERSYRLPLTQEMIADVLGLTFRSVNRGLRQLHEGGLVRIKDRLVTIENMDELMILTNFSPNYLEAAASNSCPIR
jgi:CRP-like cAMP-binding protein